ncbi:MAG TPA: acetolactate synthase small subunit [Gemmatimonadales bacterium]|nr:acetolactate synthase small subunit [Gemmatimonadales bacterium]
MSSLLRGEPATPSGEASLVSIVVDEALIPLDRVLGAIRRRNLPLVGLSVGPGPVRGTARVLASLAAAPDDVDRLARQLRKLVGVQDASVRTGGSPAVRQLALVRLTSPGARRLALLQALAGVDGSVVSEPPGETLVQIAGVPATIEAGLRLLAPFGILDVARSSPVTLDAEASVAPAPISSIRQDDRP